MVQEVDPVRLKLAQGKVVYNKNDWFKDMLYCASRKRVIVQSKSNKNETQPAPPPTPPPTPPTDMCNNNPILAIFLSDPRHPYDKCSRIIVVLCLYIANVMWVGAEMNVVCAFRMTKMDDQARAVGYADWKAAWDAKNRYEHHIQDVLNNCHRDGKFPHPVPTTGSWVSLWRSRVEVEEEERSNDDEEPGGGGGEGGRAMNACSPDDKPSVHGEERRDWCMCRMFPGRLAVRCDAMRRNYS